MPRIQEATEHEQDAEGVSAWLANSAAMIRHAVCNKQLALDQEKD